MVAPSLSLPSLIPKWPFPIFYGGQQQHQAVISIPSSLSFSLFQRVKERSRHHCAPRERERSGQFEAFKSQIELLHCRFIASSLGYCCCSQENCTPCLFVRSHSQYAWTTQITATVATTIYTNFPQTGRQNYHPKLRCCASIIASRQRVMHSSDPRCSGVQQWGSILLTLCSTTH